MSAKEYRTALWTLKDKQDWWEKYSAMVNHEACTGYRGGEAEKHNSSSRQNMSSGRMPSSYMGWGAGSGVRFGSAAGSGMRYGSGMLLGSGMRYGSGMLLGSGMRYGSGMLLGSGMRYGSAVGSGMLRGSGWLMGPGSGQMPLMRPVSCNKQAVQEDKQAKYVDIGILALAYGIRLI